MLRAGSTGEADPLLTIAPSSPLAVVTQTGAGAAAPLLGAAISGFQASMLSAMAATKPQTSSRGAAVLLAQPPTNPMPAVAITVAAAPVVPASAIVASPKHTRLEAAGKQETASMGRSVGKNHGTMTAEASGSGALTLLSANGVIPRYKDSGLILEQTSVVPLVLPSPPPDQPSSVPARATAPAGTLGPALSLPATPATAQSPAGGLLRETSPRVALPVAAPPVAASRVAASSVALLPAASLSPGLALGVMPSVTTAQLATPPFVTTKAGKSPALMLRAGTALQPGAASVCPAAPHVVSSTALPTGAPTTGASADIPPSRSEAPPTAHSDSLLTRPSVPAVPTGLPSAVPAPLREATQPVVTIAPTSSARSVYGNRYSASWVMSVPRPASMAFVLPTDRAVDLASRVAPARGEVPAIPPTAPAAATAQVTPTPSILVPAAVFLEQTDADPTSPGSASVASTQQLPDPAVAAAAPLAKQTEPVWTSAPEAVRVFAKPALDAPNQDSHSAPMHQMTIALSADVAIPIDSPVQPIIPEVTDSLTTTAAAQPSNAVAAPALQPLHSATSVATPPEQAATPARAAVAVVAPTSVHLNRTAVANDRASPVRSSRVVAPKIKVVSPMPLSPATRESRPAAPTPVLVAPLATASPLSTMPQALPGLVSPVAQAAAAQPAAIIPTKPVHSVTLSPAVGSTGEKTSVGVAGNIPARTAVTIPAPSAPAPASPESIDTMATMPAAAAVDAPASLSVPAAGVGAPVAAPEPAEQLAVPLVTLASRPGAGGSVTVHLHPAELGRVEITLDRSQSGQTVVTLRSERPETMRILTGERARIETALDRAGVPAGQRRVEFETMSTVASAVPDAATRGNHLTHPPVSSGGSAGTAFGSAAGQAGHHGATSQQAGSQPGNMMAGGQPQGGHANGGGGSQRAPGGHKVTRVDPPETALPASSATAGRAGVDITA